MPIIQKLAFDAVWLQEDNYATTTALDLKIRSLLGLLLH